MFFTFRCTECALKSVPGVCVNNKEENRTVRLHNNIINEISIECAISLEIQ